MNKHPYTFYHGDLAILQFMRPPKGIFKNIKSSYKMFYLYVCLSLTTVWSKSGYSLYVMKSMGNSSLTLWPKQNEHYVFLNWGPNYVWTKVVGV